MILALTGKLRADHAQLLDLSARLVAACQSAKPLDRMTAIQLTSKISNLARTHHALEETELFPFLARSSRSAEALHLLQEHHDSDGAMRDLVVTLRRGAPTGPSAESWAKSLRSHIEHEGRIFDGLDATLRAG